MFGLSVQNLFSIIVVLVIFLIGREAVCWYWKINYTTQLLEKILRELKQKNVLATEQIKEETN